MESVNLEVGERPSVRILHVGGDLRLTGREGTQLDAQAPDGSRLSAKKVDGHIELRCRGSCSIFLPRQAEVSVELVGGDAHMMGLISPLVLKTVGGDLRLRRVAQTTIDRVGGDLMARKVDGDLLVQMGGGDALIDRVQGRVHLESQGGDVNLRRVIGEINLGAGGDVRASLLPLRDTKTALRAAGDMAIRLSPQASATINLQAGGEVHFSGLKPPETTDDALRFAVGAGEAEVTLQTGGDAYLDVAEDEGQEESPTDLADDIATHLVPDLTDLEGELGDIGEHFSAFDLQHISDRVRRSVKSALQRSKRERERARRHFHRRAGSHGTVAMHFGETESQPDHQEQLAILRMLEQGKISREEAEALLRSLEGGS